MIEVGELAFPVALHAAASTSERVSFHILNRRTGHRVNRMYVDADTEKPVERDDQVKGYQSDDGRMVVLEPEEIAAAVPEGDKRLRIEAFIPCALACPVRTRRPVSMVALASTESVTNTSPSSRMANIIGWSIGAPCMRWCQERPSKPRS